MIVACSDCGATVESGDVFGMTDPQNWRWNRRREAQPAAEAVLDARKFGEWYEECERLRAERDELQWKLNTYSDQAEGRIEALIERARNAEAEVEALRSLLRQARDPVAVMDQRLAEISTNKEMLYAGLVSRIDTALRGKGAA